LKVGYWRELTSDEITRLKKAADMTPLATGRAPKPKHQAGSGGRRPTTK